MFVSFFGFFFLVFFLRIFFPFHVMLKSNHSRAEDKVDNSPFKVLLRFAFIFKDVWSLIYSRDMRRLLNSQAGFKISSLILNAKLR